MESSVDQQGESEVGQLPVKPLLLRIFSSPRSHIFVHSVEITNESSCRIRW